MIITLSFSSICWAGTTAAIGSLIFDILGDKCRSSGYPASGAICFLAAIFFAGCSTTLLLLTSITFIRSL